LRIPIAEPIASTSVADAQRIEATERHHRDISAVRRGARVSVSGSRPTIGIGFAVGQLHPHASASAMT
jgi:hypothetical protein